MIKPLGDRVLVEATAKEEKTASGIIPIYMRAFRQA